ncbi:MAG TPA: hypothetical protein VFG04_14085 [Planctomycetaceae bacterium]|jgi:hypothetical protein|nr:hypothetical protein [Planctomycetaceae bacterium]
MTVYTNIGSGGIKCGSFAQTNDTQVIMTAINQIDASLWQIKFRSQRVPPVTFTCYVAGQQVGTPIVSPTGTGEIRVAIAPGSSPFIEIIDHGIPHYAAPGICTLNWREIQNSQAYQVQQLIGSTWTTLQTVPEKGKGNSLFQTAWLNDQQTYDFQVVPIDAANNPGTPIGWDITIVRHPDVPNVTYTLNNNGTITIAAA